MSVEATNRTLPGLLDRALELALSRHRASFLSLAVPLAALSTLLSAQGARMSAALSTSVELAQTCGGLLMLVAFAGVALFAGTAVYGALGVIAVVTVQGGATDARAALLRSIRPRFYLTVLAAAVAMVVAAVFLLVPGLVVAVLFCLLIPVMVEEDLWGVRALARSASLAAKRQGRALRHRAGVRLAGVLWVYVLIGYGLSLVVVLPHQILLQLSLARQIASGDAASPAEAVSSLLWLQIPTNMISSLVGSWSIFYLMICLALFYRDLRDRHEGVDLEARIEALAGSRHELGELP